jgi:hypothetical protein
VSRFRQSRKEKKEEIYLELKEIMHMVKIEVTMLVTLHIIVVGHIRKFFARVKVCQDFEGGLVDIACFAKRCGAAQCSHRFLKGLDMSHGQK